MGEFGAGSFQTVLYLENKVPIHSSMTDYMENHVPYTLDFIVHEKGGPDTPGNIILPGKQSPDQR